MSKLISNVVCTLINFYPKGFLKNLKNEQFKLSSVIELCIFN